MEKEKCPQCNFVLTDNYCIKCGYQKNITILNLDEYNHYPTDLELLLKKQYYSILYNKNFFKILLLGYLYFCYETYLWVGIILLPVELLFSYIIFNLFIPIKLGLPALFLTLLTIHFVYSIFANSLIVTLSKKRIFRLKQKYPNNYQEILKKKPATSLLQPIICILLPILVVLLVTIIYRAYRGNL